MTTNDNTSVKCSQILFSGPMVCALLDGSKTLTRRVVKPQPEIEQSSDGSWSASWGTKYTLCAQTAAECLRLWCPYGQPGDRLWVPEAWRTVVEADALPPRDLTPAHRIWYEADVPFHQPGFGKLRPSMFMPRWASRITLEITGVRVERLQDISEADAIAEGIEAKVFDQTMGFRDYSKPHTWFIDWPGCTPDRAARESYRTLWDSINGGRREPKHIRRRRAKGKPVDRVPHKDNGAASWDANPWVWVIQFRRVE